MLLVAYSLTMSIATLLMAVGCWLPGILLVAFGLAISGWCWRHGRERWDGRERRTADRRERVAHLRG